MLRIDCWHHMYKSNQFEFNHIGTMSKLIKRTLRELYALLGLASMSDCIISLLQLHDYQLMEMLQIMHVQAKSIMPHQPYQVYLTSIKFVHKPPSSLIGLAVLRGIASCFTSCSSSCRCDLPPNSLRAIAQSPSRDHNQQTHQLFAASSLK